MKRSGFKQKTMATVDRSYDREQRLENRAVAAMKNVVARPANMGLMARVSTPVLKCPPMRDKAYLRRVAQLPCVNCGIAGYSQAAHANTGKGMSMKASDHDTFPLCCTRPGVPGCHAGLDQGAMFDKETRRAKEAEWVAQTQAMLGLKTALTLDTESA